jgi:hypothetical protein
VIDLYSIALGVALAAWAIFTGYVLAAWATKRWQLRRDRARRFFVEVGGSTLYAELLRAAEQVELLAPAHLDRLDVPRP